MPGRQRAERRTSGGTYVVLCTRHREKDPSLCVWRNGRFFCHGCHYRGRLEDDPALQAKVARLRKRYETSLWLFPSAVYPKT